MNANDSARLLELLARYAADYLADDPEDMTVIDVAEDLAASLAGEYAPASRLGEWCDQVAEGFRKRDAE